MARVTALHYSEGHFFGATFRPEAVNGVWVGVADIPDADLGPFTERPDQFEVQQAPKPERKGRKVDAAG